MDYGQRDSIKLMVPKNFWWLWLIGSIMIFMCAISRTDINFFNNCNITNVFLLKKFNAKNKGLFLHKISI